MNESFTPSLIQCLLKDKDKIHKTNKNKNRNPINFMSNKFKLIENYPKYNKVLLSLEKKIENQKKIQFVS